MNAQFAYTKYYHTGFNQRGVSYLSDPETYASELPNVNAREVASSDLPQLRPTHIASPIGELPRQCVVERESPH